MCGATSVCDAYGQASAVVVAELMDFKPAAVSEDRVFVGGNDSKFVTGQEVTLKVHRWYKGGKSGTIKLTQANLGCDWTFDSGQRSKKFLFYLAYSEKYKDYSVISCEHNRESRKAADDLQWLNALPDSLVRSRISGTVRIDENGYPPGSGIIINIDNGKTRFSVKTNRWGLYEKWDISPGEYRVTASPPNTLALRWTTSVPNNWLYFWSRDDQDPKALDVTIEPGGCGGVDFMFKKK